MHNNDAELFVNCSPGSEVFLSTWQTPFQFPMNMTLAQKHPIKGTREFELVDDEIRYTIKSPLKTESLSVVLNVLDSEPVVSGSTLAFVSQVNREPLVEFFVDRPDKETFGAFIETVRQRIDDENFSRFRVDDAGLEVDAARLSEAIEMLRNYVNPAEIEDLLLALNELKAQPDDVQRQKVVAEAFNALGFVQGQVITYAPYLSFLASGNKGVSDVFGADE